MKLTNMGEKYFQESDLRIWVKNQEFGPGSGSIKLFLLGGCRPPDPLLFLGGFQTPWWGACSPPHPLSSSSFFWNQSFNAQVRQVRRFEPEPPNLLFFKTGSNLWTAMLHCLQHVTKQSLLSLRTLLCMTCKLEHVLRQHRSQEL